MNEIALKNKGIQCHYVFLWDFSKDSLGSQILSPYEWLYTSMSYRREMEGKNQGREKISVGMKDRYFSSD